MKRALTLVLLTSSAVLGLSSPADAGGNFRCSAGDRNIGANACILTQWHSVPNGVKMDSIEVYVSGDRSTLEGGTCADNPAMTYNNLRIIGPNGATKWGPQAPNEVCKNNGYSDVWSSSLDSLGPISGNADVCMSFKLRNNGGLDSSGAFCVNVD